MAGPCGLVWYSVAEPVRHELPTRACVDRLRIERGRIFFVGPRGGARFLRSVSLAGEFRDHVRFGRVIPRGFDVRGARIAWAARACGGGDGLFGGRLGRRVPRISPLPALHESHQTSSECGASRGKVRLNCSASTQVDCGAGAPRPPARGRVKA